jgi:hypothetical protein
VSSLCRRSQGLIRRPLSGFFPYCSYVQTSYFSLNYKEITYTLGAWRNSLLGTAVPPKVLLQFSII